VRGGGGGDVSFGRDWGREPALVLIGRRVREKPFQIEAYLLGCIQGEEGRGRGSIQIINSGQGKRWEKSK